MSKVYLKILERIALLALFASFTTILYDCLPAAVYAENIAIPSPTLNVSPGTTPAAAVSRKKASRILVRMSDDPAKFAPGIPEDALANIHAEVSKELPAIQVDDSRLYAPRPKGTVRIAAWGATSLGRGNFGDSGKVLTVTGPPVWSDLVEKLLLPDHYVLQLVSVDAMSCLLRNDQTLWCWGREGIDYSPPHQVRGLPPINAFEMGQVNICVRDNSQRIWCIDSVTADPEPLIPSWLAANSDNPDLQKLAKDFRHFAAGLRADCAITTSGHVWCWGKAYNNNGDIHVKEKDVQIFPVLVPLPHPAISITAGAAYDCAILADRSGWCWDRKLKPVPYSPLGAKTAVRQIWPGTVLTEEHGQIFNWYRQEKQENVIPTLVLQSEGKALSHIAKISNGLTACGLDDRGRVWCWPGPNVAVNDPKGRYAKLIKHPARDDDLSHVIDIAVRGDGGAMYALLDGESAMDRSSADPSVRFMTTVAEGNFDGAVELYKTYGAMRNTGPSADVALRAAVMANRADVVKIILDTGLPIGDATNSANIIISAVNKQISPDIILMLLDHGASLLIGITPFTNIFDLIEGRYKAMPGSDPLLARIRAIRKQASHDRFLDMMDEARQNLGPNKVLLSAVSQMQTESECLGAGADSRSMLRFYPIVVEGIVDGNGELKISKVFKGFRERPIEFLKGSFPAKIASPGIPQLVMAGFDGKNAKLDKCSKVYDETGMEKNAELQKVLIEATLYDTSLKNKPNAYANSTPLAAQRLQEPHQISLQLYHEKTKALKEYNDYLYLLEVSLQKLQSAITSLKPAPDYNTSPQHMHYKIAHNIIDTLSKTRSTCLDDDTFESDFLSADFKRIYSSILLVPEDFPGRRGDVASISAASADLAEALMKVSQYRAALYILCKSQAPGLYIAAVNRLGHPELVNGRKFDRIGDLADVDLSGLVLKGISAAGASLKNVNMSGTDLTNANFESSNLASANLDGAVLHMATYNCHTVFPKGFDPVSNHMIAVASWRCEGTQPSTVNLKDVSVKPFYPEFNEYDETSFTKLQMTDIDARSAKLGHVKCTECKISNADFSGAQVALKLKKTTISDTSFRGADLRGLSMNEVSYENVDFSGANLSGVSFVGSGNTVFKNVDFGTANLTGVLFLGAKYDSRTKWPTNFEPDKAGLQIMSP